MVALTTFTLFLYGSVILSYFHGTFAQEPCCATPTCLKDSECCPAGADCSCRCALTSTVLADGTTQVSGRCTDTNLKCQTPTTGCNVDKDCCPPNPTGGPAKCFCYKQSTTAPGTCRSTCGDCAPPQPPPCCPTTKCLKDTECCPTGTDCSCKCALTKTEGGGTVQVTGRCARFDIGCKTVPQEGCKSDRECCPPSTDGTLSNCFCYQESNLQAGRCVVNCVDCKPPTPPTPPPPTLPPPSPCSKTKCETDKDCCDRRDCQCHKHSSTEKGFCLARNALLPCPNGCPITKKCSNDLDCCKCRCAKVVNPLTGGKVLKCIPK